MPLVTGASSVRLGNTLLRTHAFEDSKSDQTQAASACAHGHQLKVIIPAQTFDATLSSLQQLAPGGIHAGRVVCNRIDRPLLWV